MRVLLVGEAGLEDQFIEQAVVARRHPRLGLGPQALGAGRVAAAVEKPRPGLSLGARIIIRLLETLRKGVC